MPSSRGSMRKRSNINDTAALRLQRESRTTKHDRLRVGKRSRVAGA